MGEKYAILVNYKPLTIIQNGKICYVVAYNEETAKQICSGLGILGTIGYMVLDKNGQAYLDKCIADVCTGIINDYHKIKDMGLNIKPKVDKKDFKLNIHLPSEGKTLDNLPEDFSE